MDLTARASRERDMNAAMTRRLQRAIGGLLAAAALSCGGSTGAGIDDDGASGSSGTSGGTGTSGSSSGGGGSSGSADGGTTTPGELTPFSFFVTSMTAMIELSGSQDGFGGDLRFGETGAGAGLRGADKICAAVAERSMPGSSAKQWRAFLSVSADENGARVNAIDRVGEGPWYDRLGRVVALTKADLLAQRPANADEAIQRDLPNEDGVPNHAPNGAVLDNHDTLTGSTTAGLLSSANATCSDWTSTTASGRPMAGHSWPRNRGSSNDSAHWIAAHAVPGCRAGINTSDNGGGMGTNTVGGSGGYGGIYCFALSP